MSRAFFFLMANRATALGRADLKCPKILYSPIRKGAPEGLGGVQEVFNIPNPLKVTLKIN